MTLATTSIDYVPQERNLITDTMVRYLSTDTTCVRALFPDSLVRAQSEKWDPLVEWFFKTFNARLEVIRGTVVINTTWRATLSCLIFRLFSFLDVDTLSAQGQFVLYISPIVVYMPHIHSIYSR